MSSKVSIPVNKLALEHINRPVSFDVKLEHASVAITGILLGVKIVRPETSTAKPNPGIHNIHSSGVVAYTVNVDGLGGFTFTDMNQPISVLV